MATAINKEKLSKLVDLFLNLGIHPGKLDEMLMDPEFAESFLLKGKDSDAQIQADPLKDIHNTHPLWRSESDLGPEKPPPVLRDVLAKSYIKAEGELSRLSSGSDFRQLESSIGQNKRFSSTPSSELHKINLNEMIAHHEHKGRLLVCRTFTAAVRKVCVELCIEDMNGDVAVLTIYNFPGLCLANLETLRAYFPVGTVMAVREPWLKTSGETSFAFIRVDSPSDVAFLEPSDPLLDEIVWKTSPSLFSHPYTTTEQWKIRGNELFQGGFFIPAALAWSRGLRLDPTAHALRLNRAQSYIRLGWFSAALVDALDVLASQISDMHKKASYRAACAEYGIGHYAEALARFEIMAEDDSVASYKSRCHQRLREQSKGEYIWTDMFEHGRAAIPRLDVADFTHPAIQVAEVENIGGGRGIKATCDIEAGTLLVVAKPFASVFPAELPENEKILCVDSSTMRSHKTPHVALIARIIERLSGCPQDSNLVYHLYAGAKSSPPPLEYPLTPPQLKSEVVPLQWQLDVDVNRIEAVVAYNFFSPNSLNLVTAPPPGTNIKGGEDKPCALYTLPAIFNHSCHPNAMWDCFGDVMVIRARESIRPGQEITISYMTGLTLGVRERKLRPILEQACVCPLCTSERADGVEACRQRELTTTRLDDWELNTSAAEAQITKLLSTYSAKQSLPRPPLFHAYFQYLEALALDVGNQNGVSLLKQKVLVTFKALDGAGFTEIDSAMHAKKAKRYTLPLCKNSLATSCVNIDFCALIMASASSSLLALSEPICAERWLRAAWWVHDSTFGGGRALFEMRLGNTLKYTPMPLSTEYRWD